jgi:drug/metabolite transporter (DMT)-like permease
MTSSTTRATLWPAAALVIFWSSGFVGAELGTRQAPAATLLAWRYLAAAIILVAVCAWRRESISRSILGRQVVLGVLCQVLYLGLTVSSVGMGVPAGTTALIASLQPLVVVVLAAAFLSERAATLQLLGLGIAIAGVLLVVVGDLGGSTAAWWVYALPVGGMVSLACGTVLQQRWQEAGSLLMSITVQTVTGAVAFWALAGVEGTAGHETTPAFWGAVAWVVVLSSFGGYGTYLYVSRTQGATRASTLLYLTPPTTMLWTALMFGDRVQPAGLAGLGLTAVGVGLALRSTTKPRRAPLGSPPRPEVATSH